MNIKIRNTFDGPLAWVPRALGPKIWIWAPCLGPLGPLAQKFGCWVPCSVPLGPLAPKIMIFALLLGPFWTLGH